MSKHAELPAFNITHSWYTQSFQTRIRWKNL